MWLLWCIFTLTHFYDVWIFPCPRHTIMLQSRSFGAQNFTLITVLLVQLALRLLSFHKTCQYWSKPINYRSKEIQRTLAQIFFCLDGKWKYCCAVYGSLGISCNIVFLSRAWGRLFEAVPCQVVRDACTLLSSTVLGVLANRCLIATPFPFQHYCIHGLWGWSCLRPSCDPLGVLGGLSGAYVGTDIRRDAGIWKAGRVAREHRWQNPVWLSDNLKGEANTPTKGFI